MSQTEYMLFGNLIMLAVSFPFAFLRKMRRKQNFFLSWLWCMGIVYVISGGIYYGVLASATSDIDDQAKYAIFALVFLVLLLGGIARDVMQVEKENEEGYIPSKFKLVINNIATTLFVIILSVNMLALVLFLGAHYLASGNNIALIQATPTSTIKPTRTRWPTNPPQNTLSFEDYYQKKSTKTPFPTKTKSPNTCQPYRYITLSDVGDTVCVWGIVKKAWYDEQQDAFFMTFSNDPRDLYLIVYGVYYEDVQNHCVQLTGEVKKLGQTPVMTVYDYTLYNCDN